MMQRSDLHEYQNRSHDHVIEHLGSALHLDPGLGKTVSILTAIDTLMYDMFCVRGVLIAAPLRVVQSVWRSSDGRIGILLVNWSGAPATHFDSCFAPDEGKDLLPSRWRANVWRNGLPWKSNLRRRGSRLNIRTGNASDIPIGDFLPARSVTLIVLERL